MNPKFFLAEAWRSIRANAAVSVAATITVLIAVFILGAFIPSFLYVQSTVDSQKDKVDIDAYISDSATVPQVEGLRTQLAALQSQGQVESFTYVSKDDALVELRERLKDPSILEELPSNPLPAKFNIKPVDPENAQGIIDQISDSPAIDQELGISYGAETADRLLSVARFIQWAGLGLITILLVASILLIGNTIRLSIFARRREVEVMKLVGAILSVALLWAVKIGVVDQWIQDADSALTRDQATTIGFPLLCVVLILAGGLVGALGSGITLRRFLKV